MNKALFYIFLSLVFVFFSCEKDDSNMNQVIDPGNQSGGVDTFFIIVEGITLINGSVVSISSTSVSVDADVPTISPTKSPIKEHGHMLFDFLPSQKEIEEKKYVQKNELGAINTSNYSYESKFDDLVPNTTYYYLAYVNAIVNGNTVVQISGVLNGENFIPDLKSFTTANNEFPPDVSTLDFDYLQPNSYYISGRINETNENQIRDYGFVWKAGNGIPTVLDNDGKFIVNSDVDLNNGHDFDASISVAPNKSYNVAAYASNDFGIDYGEMFVIFGNYNWSNYNSSPESVLKDCHVEKFTDNLRGWDTSEASNYDIDYYMSTSSNYYNIDNDEEDIAWNLLTRDINLNGLDHYQIDLDVRVIQGDSASGLRWEGGNGNSFGYIFGFDRDDKKYSIGYWDINDNYVSIKSGIEPDILTTNDYHKLTIRKLDSIFYLFINEIFIHSFSDLMFEGNNIHFRCGSKSDVYFKNFYVKSFEQCH